MSLQLAAQHLSHQGRGPDDTLVHMSKNELKSLNDLAMAHGGQLTINPQTGLPEAGMLDKLLPTIIGAGISYFSGGTISPAMAGIGVGAFETVRSGSLEKGLMAGLGAYGGAGLTSGLMGAGLGAAAETLGQANASAATTLGAEANARDILMARDAAPAMQMAESPLSSGVSQLFKDPSKVMDSMGGGFNTIRNIGSAAAPLLGAEEVKANMPKTTTQPGKIRTYSYNPYGQTYTSTGDYEVPVTAADGGLMGMYDGNYNPSQLNFAQRSEPVVRMADGGTPPQTVEDLYTSILGRPSDAGGKAFWQERFGDTLDANEINAFTQSANVELANRTAAQQQALAPNAANGVVNYTPPPASGIPNTSPTQYKSAADLYQSILGRAPSQQDEAAWNNWFGESIDENDVMGFKNAAQAELANKPAASAPASAVSSLGSTEKLQSTIGDIYRNAFGRDPDYQGLQNWTNYAQTSGVGVNDLYKSIISAGRNNSEMLTPYGKLVGSPTEAAAQITNMYRNVLGRDPDPGGLAYWTERIASGELPEKVYNEFLGAARENTELVTADQIKNKNFISAIVPYSGYRSTDETNIVDEWVRNTLGREPTETDKAQIWYKDAFNAMRTIPEATNLFGKFQEYAKKDAAATTAQKIKDATASLAERGLTEADVIRETGKTIAQLAASDIDLTKNLVAASQLIAPGTKAGFDFSSIKAKPRTTPQTNAPAGTTNPYGNVTNPGDITRNPDGSTTVTPNIPGRPYGGFSGMGQVKDAYTAGGGSLGYKPYAPKTMEEFNQLYNNQTGGSKQAYDYLTGKADYSATPYTKTGELMKPYSESVLGVPSNTATKKVLFDPATKKYKTNPDYVPISYSSKGEKVYGLSDREIIKRSTAGEDFAKESGVTYEQISKALNISIDEAKKRYPGLAAPTTASTEVAPEPFNYTGNRGGMGGSSFGGTNRAAGGLMDAYASGGMSHLGDYSDGGRLLRGPGDGVSDSIPAVIGRKQPARLADGEFVVPARIVSELGNGSTEAGARKLYAMMDRIQKARGNTVGKGKVAKNSRSEKYLPA